MKRRTVLKSTFLSLLAVSTPALAGVKWNPSMTPPGIGSVKDAIQLYGFLNGVTPASQEAVVSVFPHLLPLLSAPRLDVGYGEASGASRATQAASAAMAHPLLAHVDLASINHIHIAIKCGRWTRLGEISAATKTIRGYFPDTTWSAVQGVSDDMMGDRVQVSVLVASLQRS